jgi:MFS family permease
VSTAAHAERARHGAVAAAVPRRWAITGALSITETVSYGILYYAFAVFLVPMRDALGLSTAQLTGAFSVGILVSAVAGVAVGRHLDHHGPRALMTLGSIGAVALVVAWSRVESLLAVYLVWSAMGLVMAAVLYEAAFTVLAKHFTEPAERRRAMTAMTLVAALASFIFLPLSQALIDAMGWRDALLVLAAVLAVFTVPLHGIVLRSPPGHRHDAGRTRQSAGADARRALRSAPFWLLTSAFFLASVTAIAVAVHAVAFLLERGYEPGFAAFAVGLVGVSQIPGRLLFGPFVTRVARPPATATLFLLIATGVGLVVAANGTPLTVAGLVLLGMGNGMATLARATAIAELYGARAYGTIASVAATLTTTARAAAPVAAALVAGAVGYVATFWALAALAVAAAALAYVAEVLAPRDLATAGPAPHRATGARPAAPSCGTGRA